MSATKAQAPTLLGGLRRSMAWSCAGAVLAYSVAELSVSFLVLTSVGVLAAWVVAVGPGRPAPRRAINVGLVGVVGIGLLQTLRLGLTVSAFASFIGMLLVVKLFDLRRAQDWGQAIVLVTGLVVAAVLTSNSMPTGLLLALDTFLLFRAILRYQLFLACERGGLEPSYAVGRDVRRDLRSVQIGAGFGICLIGTAVFLFLPRDLGSEAFGSWGNASLGQTTGFSDEVELGRPGLISQSPTPVMDVEVFDRSERNIGRLDAPPIYLRGAVLDEYEQGRWTRGLGRGQRGVLRAQFVPDGSMVRPWISADRTPWDMELRITVRHTRAGSTPMFTTWEPLILRPVNAGQFVSLDPQTGVVTREGPSGRLDYAIRSANPSVRKIEYDPEIPRVPPPETEISPRIRAFAVSVLETAQVEPDPEKRPVADDVRAVRVLEKHLQTNFAYTLVDEPTPPGRDATEWFLDDRKQGHCEYFASALALACRSVGIDARVVTGYVVSDFNEVTGEYVVRESSAHAWVEAQIAPETWLTFDGTPRADFHDIHQPEPSLWRSVQKLYETVEFAWVNAVVAYDTDDRRRLFGALATDFGIQRISGALIDKLQNGGIALLIRAGGVALGVFCVSLFAGLVTLRSRVALRRLSASLVRLMARLTPGRWAKRDAGERLLDDTLDVLRRLGVPKPEGVPMRRHLALVGQVVPVGVLLPIQRACEALYRLRYAPGDAPPPSELDGLRRALFASENAHRSENRSRGVKARGPRPR